MARSSAVSAPKPRPNSRVALLDAALTLVRKHGWTATRIDQLCEAAGVTKGAFFHHFASKDALGVAAARHWSEVTGSAFAAADYHDLPDPLARIFGYLDLRAQMAQGPLEAFTCFAGTTIQEVFATSETIRAAAAESIFDHVRTLTDDFREALATYPSVQSASARSLAVYTQTVLQGGFLLSKAEGDAGPVLEAIAHLRRYLKMLFNQRTTS